MTLLAVVSQAHGLTGREETTSTSQGARLEGFHWDTALYDRGINVLSKKLGTGGTNGGLGAAV